MVPSYVNAVFADGAVAGSVRAYAEALFTQLLSAYALHVVIALDALLSTYNLVDASVSVVGVPNKLMQLDAMLIGPVIASDAMPVSAEFNDTTLLLATVILAPAVRTCGSIHVQRLPADIPRTYLGAVVKVGGDAGK